MNFEAYKMMIHASNRAKRLCAKIYSNLSKLPTWHA